MYIPLTAHILEDDNAIEFNEIESAALERTAEKKKLYRTELPSNVQYFHAKNYTVSLVQWQDGEQRIGVAKRNPIDRPNRIKGEAIAFVRAISV